MESEALIWQVALIALAAGVLIGILGYRLLAPAVKQADRVQSELDEARDELARYRAEVDSHFNKTSELVNDLTQDYVKVYQHLAEGVQTLGNSRSFHNLLEQQPGRVVLTVDDDGKARAPVDYAADDTATAPAPPGEPAVGEAAAEAAQPAEPSTGEEKTGQPPVAQPAAEKAAADGGGDTDADTAAEKPAAQTGPAETEDEGKKPDEGRKTA